MQKTSPVGLLSTHTMPCQYKNEPIVAHKYTIVHTDDSETDVQEAETTLRSSCHSLMANTVLTFIVIEDETPRSIDHIPDYTEIFLNCISIIR